MWRDNPSALTINNRSVEQEIRSLLEWYIGECIPYGPHSLGGWWSDGVIHLEIHETAPDSFKLLGVTWIDCLGTAPFEIDVELNSRDDSHFAKTVFRIGVLDDSGRPKIVDRRFDARSVLERRPRRNRDWAMAIELTPPRSI
jgi:hypothetical protein